MRNFRGNAENLAIGAGAAFLLYCIIGFYPAWVIMLSLIDTIFDVSSGEINNEAFASACFWGCILFILLSSVLSLLISFIEDTWWIVAPVYLFCIYPFIRWIFWVYEDVPYSGIDWFPW